jgi:hypothetical protein
MQKFTSRLDCCISPCKARAPGNNPASSFADSLFSVKIIVRPPLNKKHASEKHIPKKSLINKKLKEKLTCHNNL